MGTPEIVLLMPAYNAGRTVERVFARIPAEARARIGRFVVLDDGSTDDTREALGRVARDFPGLVVLEHGANRGYGAAMKTLLGHARSKRADAAIVLHADGQYAPEQILALLAPIADGDADVVQGSRMLGGGALAGGMPLYKYAANRILTFIENRAFGLGLAEYHSGYMVYSGRALERIAFERLSDTFVFDLEMLVAARVLRLRVRELPVPTSYADEVSHLRPVRYGFEVLGVMRRYGRGRYHALLGDGSRP
jgi:glycosyltransferase involved in cell wall biosynthesis